MDWKISYLEEDNIVLAKMLNLIDTLEQMKKMCAEAASLGRYNQSLRYLLDHRDVTLGLSILQIEEIPNILKEARIDPESKVALLIEPSSPNKRDFEFVKNVLSLVPLEFNIFVDEKEAINWLKSADRITNTK